MKGSHGIKKLYGVQEEGMGWRKNLSNIFVFIIFILILISLNYYSLFCFKTRNACSYWYFI